MTTKKKRVPRATQIPMLVMRGVVNDDLELRERMAVEAFALGFATETHYNTLADMQGSMMLAATARKETIPAATYARDVVGPVLASIVRRWQKTEKFGCTGDELVVLREFVTKHREFWLRQPLGLYTQAYRRMKEVQADLRAKQKLVSE